MHISCNLLKQQNYPDTKIAMGGAFSSKKKKNNVNNVNNKSFSKSNCVVTLGPDGKTEFSIPLEQGKKAYFIIDPRMCGLTDDSERIRYLGANAEVIEGAGEGNVMYVLLMSSLTSGPEARMSIECSANCMGVFSSLGALKAGPESSFFIR